MAVAQLQAFIIHLQFHTNVILPPTLQHTKPDFSFTLQSSLFILYSMSICNRSLYSTLLCKILGFSGVWHAQIYSVCCKCPEVMDVNGHVVCFWQLQYFGLASYPLQPVFRTNCISYKLWKWLDLQCLWCNKVLIFQSVLSVAVSVWIKQEYLAQCVDCGHDYDYNLSMFVS